MAIFYRGSWCPYCNIALTVYQAELLPRLAGRGIPLVAISPEKPDGSLTMRDRTRNLPMPATVILDRNRTVRWIDVHPDYSTSTEPRQVIAALDHLVAEEKK